jgi:hypothetical protein
VKKSKNCGRAIGRPPDKIFFVFQILVEHSEEFNDDAYQTLDLRFAQKNVPVMLLKLREKTKRPQPELTAPIRCITA